MVKSVGLIIAKGDSKRLQGKNWMDFNGKPMFLWNLLKMILIFDKVYVSSDYDFILDTTRKYGGLPIKRPRRLCGDIPNISVYQHAVLQMKPVPDTIVAVQANSPTIEKWLIEQAKNIIEQEDFPISEFRTVHPDKSSYGSIWALKVNKLFNYKNPYKPKPDSTLIDESIDIHDIKDYQKALCQLKS